MKRKEKPGGAMVRRSPSERRDSHMFLHPARAALTLSSSLNRQCAAQRARGERAAAAAAPDSAFAVAWSEELLTSTGPAPEHKRATHWQKASVLFSA